ERGLEIEVQAVEARAAVGSAVAAVVEQQYVEALRRQPDDARDVRADVLGIAVQEQDAAAPRRARRQKPAVQADAIGRPKLDFAVIQADLVGRQHQLAHWLEDQPGTAAERQGEAEKERPPERPGAPQKYQCSEVDHSACAPAPSFSIATSSPSARLRPRV